MRGIVQQGQMDRAVGAHQRISMWSLSCHEAFWSSCAKTDRWIQGDSSSWCLYCCCVVAVADMSIFVSVPTLTRCDRDSGSAVISGPAMWFAGPDRSWGFMSESGVWARLCVHCFVEKDTSVLTPKHHSCWTFLSSTSYRHDMLWPHPAHCYLHKITLYWYTKVNGIM